MAKVTFMFAKDLRPLRSYRTIGMGSLQNGAPNLGASAKRLLVLFC